MTLTITTPAVASVTYHFDFSNISNFNPLAGPPADFSLEYVLPDYITVTGLTPYTPQATTLGYDVGNFGTNNGSFFAFSHVGGVLTDFSFTYSSTSFVFALDPPVGSYLTAPGVYTGLVFGNTTVGLGGFTADGRLTITAPPAVPEPAIWALTILGFGVVGGAMRWRRALPLAA